MLAVSDGADQATAESAAKAWGKAFHRVRAKATLPFTPFKDAIEAANLKGNKPLRNADTSDQAGSGAPGDTTHELKTFIDAGIPNAVVAPLWAPSMVKICFHIEIGAKLPLRIGGKFEPHSGPPLDADSEVLYLKRHAHEDPAG